MFTFILALHIIVAIAMIGLILIQHGKGADAGASFGAGSSGTVFGAAGTANFLTRATAVLTVIFFITSMALAVHAREQAQDQISLDTSSLSVPANPRPLTDNPQQ
ncbi:preprotein translocase subunit SecG [Psychrobacter sp. AH5]|uniref:preprotein translocase subunit SecG n=1 Tax=Psychrobacter sp. AH5 TaxID=2937433 RepID=UPI003340B39D